MSSASSSERSRLAPHWMIGALSFAVCTCVAVWLDVAPIMLPVALGGLCVAAFMEKRWRLWLCALMLVPALALLAGDAAIAIVGLLMLGLLALGAYGLGAAMMPRPGFFRACGGVLSLVAFLGLIFFLITPCGPGPLPKSTFGDLPVNVHEKAQEGSTATEQTPAP